jgi:KamA family protein
MLRCNDSVSILPSTDVPTPRYRAYNLANFRSLPQVQALGEDRIFEMEVVAQVFPFKTNSYVVDELIDWDAVPDDPMFVLTFPQRDMLRPEDYDRIAELMRSGADKATIRAAADEIRMTLNPHPAGQLEKNVPDFGEDKLEGTQHKYRETILFFPSQGQTCHAYCTFCFRWPQFVGMTDLRFATREAEKLVAYLRRNPHITDVLFTGGDPLIMKTPALRAYVRTLLDADLPGFQTIRIGTKSLSYWPYRFLTDDDAGDLLDLFREVTDAGKHLALMAHFNHPVELETEAAREAVRAIRDTGAEIRSQSPVLTHINDSADAWADMWREQVRLGIIPYYMFLVRDTGAQHYFGVPLAKGYEIYREAFRRVSGLARTVRGPSMSATPGKVHVLGTTEVNGEKLFVLQFLQGRDPAWCNQPFFARYDEDALWVDDLVPAFGEERFFFEEAEETASA